MKIGRRSHSQVLLLVAKFANQFVVQRCCRKAMRAGVEQGMSLKLAKAFSPQSLVAEFDAVSDLKMLLKLAVWVNRFSPFVGFDRELIQAFKQQEQLSACSELHDGFILDISGTQTLYKQEAKLVRMILEDLRELKIEARVAIADTIGAAWAFSRYGKEQVSIIHSKELKFKLELLPVEALRVDQETVLTLNEIGICQIRDLLNLPLKKLMQRFGFKLVRRIDQALGAVDEVFKPLRFSTPIYARRVFDTALTKQENVARALISLFEKVLQDLSLGQKKTARFIVELEVFNQDFKINKINKEISLHSAARSLDSFLPAISKMTESFYGFNGIRAFSVKALDLQKDVKRQSEFVHNVDWIALEIAAKQLFNNLLNGFGKQAVKKVCFRQSYLPERSYSFYSVQDEKVDLINQPIVIVKSDRPSCILTQPEAITAIALLPDYPPAKIYWRDKEYQIIKAKGPERIVEEWWYAEKWNNGKQLPARDYFKLQDHLGRWIWVYRLSGSQEWFVHGIWG